MPAGEQRRSVHARISAALEQRAAAPDDALSERAHHACEAVPLAPAGRAVELARRAGEQAARQLDFERAVSWYERALSRLAFMDREDPALRATLLLGLGAAQTRALGLERARASYREAADHARAIGRSDLLVSAALGFAHRPNSSGQGDSETIRLLEEAQRSVPADEEALRIRLLSRLAVELRYADRGRAEALMEEAIDAARRFGDSPSPGSDARRPLLRALEPDRQRGLDRAQCGGGTGGDGLRRSRARALGSAGSRHRPARARRPGGRGARGPCLRAHGRDAAHALCALVLRRACGR